MPSTKPASTPKSSPPDNPAENHFLHKLLHPESVAFYGANEDPITTMGTIQMLNLLDQGYPGRVYPVHPRLEEVLGLPAYKNIADVPEVPDLAFLVLPTRVIPQVLEELGQKGVDRAIMVTAGFREVDNAAGEREIARIADKYGIRFTGPNVIGAFNSHVDPADPTAFFNTTWVHYPGKQGNVSIATQSGTFACHTFFLVERLGVHLSKTISIGNEANVDICDCMEYLRDDPTTDVICLYIEELKRGDLFLRLAREITPVKPIIAIYVGGTAGGARAVNSHTGSMAGNDEVFDAAFAQTGIRRVYTMEEMMETAALFSTYVPRGVIPEGRKLGIITNSGGTGATMSDLASRLGLVLPEFSPKLQQRLARKLPHTAGYRNPLDFTFAINPELFFDSVPRQVFRSGEVDAIIEYGAFGSDFFQYGSFGQTFLDTAEAKEKFTQYNQLQDAVLDRVAKYPEKFHTPVAYINLMGLDDDIVVTLREKGLVVYQMPDQAVRAMAHLVEYGIFRRACGK